MIHRREQECFSLLCMIFHNLWNSSGITATQIGNIIQTVKLFHTSLFTVSFSSLFFPFFLNHNYSKILKSDWPSTVLISPLVGQYALCLLVGQHAPLQSCTQMLFFFSLLAKSSRKFLRFNFEQS